VLACQLLLNIWREQEVAKGIVDAAGVLARTEEPLAGVGKGQGEKGGLMVMEVAAGYGYLQPERQQLLMRIGTGASAEHVMEKVREWLGSLGLLQPTGNSFLPKLIALLHWGFDMVCTLLGGFTSCCSSLVKCSLEGTVDIAMQHMNTGQPTQSQG
jgi:hypothetical protein